MKRNKKHSKKKTERSYSERGRTNYEFIVPESANFDAYYKIQNICPPEEWDAFKKCLQNHLPTTFRITDSKFEAKALRDLIQGQYFKNILNAKKEEGSPNPEPVPLPWYPDNLAWQIQLTRTDIRKSEELMKLHKFLISETESGNISRQEAVSMIPPLALDVKPHHTVLDMCAAPGSKTAQLIEYLHKGNRIPEGMIVANDVSNSRCYMLVHQAMRLSSANILFTNHDASRMPNFMVTSKDGGEEILKFDRILCDVPCSGDGTLRKNADIWPKWTASSGIHIHNVQFRIAKRGCEMLKVGGRLVYSTCSFNPVENEAVVMRLLTEAKNSLKLVDLSSSFPGLKYQKGMKTWTPMWKEMVPYKKFEDVPEKYHSFFRPYMFPPSEEVASGYNIDRCIRILPHHQDTGGFFVAALEKVDNLPWESSKQANNTTAAEADAEDSPSEAVEPAKEPAKKRQRFSGYREDPFVFFTEDEPVWQKIRDYFDLSSDLPVNCLLTRCKEGKKKNIYLTSPKVREIIMKNADRIKIINSGVKTFARCDNKETICPFRIAQEGLYSIFPYVGQKRIVRVTKQDLLLMLSVHNTEKALEIAKLDPKTQEKMKSVGQGSCIIIYDEEPVTESSLHLELVCWIGVVSARPYLHKNEIIHYLRLLGGDTSMFEKLENNRDQDEDGKTESDVTSMECDAVGKNN
ncbi:UNVERIFIED_CONTAM: hypothetical protein PYX00_001755 [Menopon gallinae]|uniref:tRNA (cytosine(34)-C(5))-methyltransferase n=1 Tax=Menopon gallinae TaxID=328185 RepID=A0AAW2IG86_9NEOP